MQIRKILVPTDFSETAKAALDQGVLLASRFDAELTVLHARLLFEDDPTELSKNIHDLEEEENAVVKNLMERMRMGTEKLHHLKIKHEIIQGYSAPSAILGYINKNPFDLVVMGTHGRTGLEHFLLGSVAEKVVRYARCPVLTIRSKEFIHEKFEKIVVPFDLSEPSLESLRLALAWDSTNCREIHLLYAIEQDVHPALYAWGMKSIGEIIPDIQKRVEEKMDEAINQLSIPGHIHLHKVIREGKAYRVISEYTGAISPHLVVLGTHGLVGLDRFLLGSTTEKVIRSVKQPVLTNKMKNLI